MPIDGLSVARLLELGGLKRRCSAPLRCVAHGLAFPCEICDLEGSISVACEACGHCFKQGLLESRDRPCQSEAVFLSTGKIAFEAEAVSAQKAIEDERRRAEETERRRHLDESIETAPALPLPKPHSVESESISRRWTYLIGTVLICVAIVLVWSLSNVLKRNSANTLWSKGNTFNSSGMFNESIAACEEAVRIIDKDDSPKGRQIAAGSRMCIAVALVHQEKIHDAISIYEKVDHFYANDQRSGTRELVAMSLDMRAFLLAEQGKNLEAISIYEEVLRRYASDVNLSSDYVVMNSKKRLNELRRISR